MDYNNAHVFHASYEAQRECPAAVRVREEYGEEMYVTLWQVGTGLRPVDFDPMSGPPGGSYPQSKLEVSAFSDVLLDQWLGWTGSDWPTPREREATREMKEKYVIDWLVAAGQRIV